MIRFESSEALASRNAPNATKIATPALAATASPALETAQEGLFSSEGAESGEEQGVEGKKTRGRSRKFRS